MGGRARGGGDERGDDLLAGGAVAGTFQEERFFEGLGGAQDDLDVDLPPELDGELPGDLRAGLFAGKARDDRNERERDAHARVGDPLGVTQHENAPMLGVRHDQGLDAAKLGAERAFCHRHADRI